jgi:hypothetical protein
MTTTKAPRIRDPRLDFFRGLAMFIILVAHITDNPWALFIPARFGFSDATEIFVFCSGMASAIAFGTVFARAGFLWGCLRIAYRVWQVYWVHLGVFFVALAAMLALNATGVFPRDEVGALNLYPFFQRDGANLLGLLTLTYVPNYFDVLPMYLVILALIPVMIGLARLDPSIAIAVSVVMWLAATLGMLDLPAEWWFAKASERPWFFNPFAWQLVFFTGFALMAGWLPAPPVRRGLVWLAVAVVVLSVPFAWYKAIDALPAVQDWRRDWGVLIDKTGFGILRYVHFLALAYLAWVAVGPGGRRLTGGPVVTGVVRVISGVGQQSLAVFAASMVLARVLGAVLDLGGSGPLVTLAVNLAGMGLIIGVAALMRVIKRRPWETARAAPVPDALPEGVRT